MPTKPLVTKTTKQPTTGKALYGHDAQGKASKLATAKAKMREALATYHAKGGKGPLPAKKTTFATTGKPQVGAGLLPNVSRKPGKTTQAPDGAPAAPGNAPKPKSALEQLLDAMVREKYGSAEDQLAKNTADETAKNAAGGQIDQVWAGYQDQLGKTIQQQQANLQAAAAQQATVAAGAQGMVGATAAQQAQELATQATTAPAGVQADPKALAEQLKATLGAYAAVGGQELATSGFNAQTHLTDLQAIGGRDQAGAHMQAAAVLRQLADDKLGLEKDKGATRLTAKQDLIQQAQTLKLAYDQLDQKAAAAQQAAALKELGIEVADENADATRDQQGKIAGSKLELDAQKLDLASKKFLHGVTVDAAKLSQADRVQDFKEIDAAAKNGIQRGKARTAEQARKDKKINDARKAKGLGPIPDGGGRSNGVVFTADQKADWSNKKAKVKTLGLRYQQLMRSGDYANDKGEVDTEKVTKRLKQLVPGISREEMNMARDLAIYGRLSPTNQKAAAAYFPKGLVPKGFLVG